MKRRTTIGLAVVIVLAVIGGGVAMYFWPRTPIVVADRLCEYVQNETKMNCVATLATDSFVHPGSIIDYQPSKDPARDRVPLPVADLLGPSCLVPGSRELVDEIGVRQDVSIPTLSYQTNGDLSVGADVEIPKLYGTDIKAGPKWSNVKKIDLASEDAWITQFDENLAVSTFKSCKIRKECVDRLLSRQYRVIGTALVAKGLSYKFYDKSDNVISIDAALKQDAFTTNVGTNSKVMETTDASLKSSQPRVVGLKFLPNDVFSGQQVCESTVLFTADGSATVRVGGGGGVGHMRRDTKKAVLNKVASVSLSGSERSECDENFELTKSSANATAFVKATDNGKMTLSYKLSAQGGHYVTAAQCLAGHVIGKTGHDNTASASTTLRGTIFVTIRSEQTPALRVAWDKMPPSGATLRVVDWNGELLRDLKGNLVEPISASDSGSTELETRGPGVYRVEATFEIEDSATGAGNSNQSVEASVTVSALK